MFLLSANDFSYLPFFYMIGLTCTAMEWSYGSLLLRRFLGILSIQCRSNFAMYFCCLGIHTIFDHIFCSDYVIVKLVSMFPLAGSDRLQDPSALVIYLDTTRSYKFNIFCFIYPPISLSVWRQD